MNPKDICILDWQYNYWADINQTFPIGSVVRCNVIQVKCCYAFLTTEEDVTCFLDRKKVGKTGGVQDLTRTIKIGEQFNCMVCDYNFDKKSLKVSLNIINKADLP